MRHVIFVVPFFLDTALRFFRAALEQPDCRVFLISQDQLERLAPELRQRLAGHYRVDNIFDPDQLTLAARSLQQKAGRIDALLGTLEHLQVHLAIVRERLGITGLGAEASENFRDKARMKDVLRAKGVPCAHHGLIEKPADAWAFIDRVGFPIVVKPPDGAGAKGTFQVKSREELERVLRQTPPSPSRPLMAEEFIRGTEHSFDGVSIDGRLVWHSITHYLPTPLDVLQNPWMQWCILLPREIDDPKFDDIRRVAGAALDALGMTTGVCHMEWFRRADGTLAVSEVGARPGGAQISKLMSYAHDFDFYRAWARLMIFGEFNPPRREYAAGAAFLRGQGAGRVRKIWGLAEAQQEIGPLVVETRLPRTGQIPSSSYEGDGYALLRHRETRVVEKALHRLISLIRVELG